MRNKKDEIQEAGMKLISCHIENFGRLRNFDFVFDDGLNVICRENGWGKSTFAAFVLAMLYGLPAARKKTAGQNQRRKYYPWLGGAFGGRLIFEAGGRTYEVTRIFGARESEDVFELRDHSTNLACADFTENLGEELFHIDRESFLRTAFTAQQDCAAQMTDDVSALVGNLTERAGDMGSFEEALRILTGAESRLTPKRKTGTLARRAREIAALERDLAEGRTISRELENCRRKRAEGAARQQETEERLRALEEMVNARTAEAEEASAAQRMRSEAQVRKETWKYLKEKEQARREDLENAASRFAGPVPSRAQAAESLRRCREMERLEAQMEAAVLTPREQERLTELEEKAGFGRTTSGKPFPSRRTGARQEERESLLMGRQNLLPPAAAAAAAGAGLFLLLTGHPAVIGLIAAGIVLLCLERFLFAGGTSEEYAYLKEKEQEAEILHARFTEARRPLLQYLRAAGVSPGEDLRAQLEELRDAVDDYEDAKVLFFEAREEADAFEKKMTAPDSAEAPPEAGVFEGKMTEEGLRGEDSGRKPTPEDAEKSPEAALSLAELGGQIRSLSGLLRGLREDNAAVDRRIEELQKDLEEREDLLRRLHALQRRQSEEERKYRQILAASASLQKAKENLTARYADPICQGVRRYWERISGYSAEGVRMDANASITVEEMGRQRETSLLSTGYEDLAGICLRMALADAMYPPGERERPPLIMDDPFTNLDDEKQRGALRLLQEAADQYQILYLTCSSARCRV